MLINQGDIFWVELSEQSGAQTTYKHPHVIIQNNVFNSSLIQTVVVCTLSSNLKLAAVPGNILLEPDETNLPDQRVVKISHIFTVGKKQLIDRIATLSPERVDQILEGVQLLIRPIEAE